MFVDTHCHIHEADYPLDRDEVLFRAREAGVPTLIAVGTSLASSQDALQFAAQHDAVYASIGIHPHETSVDGGDLRGLELNDTLRAVGEIGLDYFYTHSPKSVQIAALEQQLQFARDHALPVIFHVREAFTDFWPVFDNFSGIQGVLHSFTDSRDTLEQAIRRGLFIGVNGIATFARQADQQAMYEAIPLERMLLETDAPFLTPVPYRGTVNEPAYVVEVARFIAEKRGISITDISEITTNNAHALFALA